MTPNQRDKAMRRWDRALRCLAHRVSDLEDLEAAPIPIAKKDRWELEDDIAALRREIVRGLELIREIEKDFPECRFWKDHKRKT